MAQEAFVPGTASVSPIDGRDGHALARIALALTSTLDLQEVLERIVSVALESSRARRASLLVLEGDRLVPRVAIGAEPNEPEFERFQAMEPIVVGPLERAILDDGLAVGIADARATELVPEEWTTEFNLRRIGIVPLKTSGVPSGLMVVDWPTPAPFADSELRRLEAVASFAGLAIGNAKLFEQERRSAALQAMLAAAAAELGQPLEPRVIARRLVPTFVNLLGAKACAIVLLDPRRLRFTAVASRGLPRLSAPVELSDVPPELIKLLTKRWNGSRATVELAGAELTDFLGAPRDVARFLFMPLKVDTHTAGVVVLGFDAEKALDADEQAAAEALVSMAAAALERQAHVGRLRRQVRQLDALHKLSGALTERADIALLIRELNDLLVDHGTEVVGITFQNRRLARYLASDDAGHASGHEGVAAKTDGDVVAVPIHLGRRPVGELLVRGSAMGTADLAFLESVAAGLAEIVNRGELRAASAAADKERAVAAERDRMAADIHDTAGQMFVGIGLLARRYAEQNTRDADWEARTRRIAGLADRGKWETDQAVRALAFLPAAHKGLVPALRGLAQSFAEDSGIDVLVDVEGRSARLQPKIERALYRIAHEVFTNAWKHARCQVIRVTVTFTRDEVTLLMADDGIGLALRHPQTGVHMGMASMRHTLDEVGGKLSITNARPRGLVMEARVPRDGR